MTAATPAARAAAGSTALPPLVVAIGASAGGIPALKALFSLLPSDSGIAFVVELHLSPKHESHLAAILHAETTMPVSQVAGPTTLEPNRAASPKRPRSLPTPALLDIGLPDIDGYEVARRIRGTGNSLVMIAITGWGTPADRQRSLDAGIEHHIVKPVRFEVISRILAHASRAEA